MNDRMIRLFLSSTFLDFKEERDLLNRFVFSKLEAYCRKWGVSFQVIDLRWGIPERSAHNNETMQICLDEIERCQKLSPDMNFLILSGARYGWIPLPGFISAADWEQLSARMTPAQRDTLSHWYLPDENDQKRAYVLRKRTGAEEVSWEETEGELQKILFPLAGECFEGDALVPYGLSATEQEIYKGFLNVVNEDSLRNTLVLWKDPVPGEEAPLGAEVVRLREKISDRIGEDHAREQIFRYTLATSHNTPCDPQGSSGENIPTEMPLSPGSSGENIPTEMPLSPGSSDEDNPSEMSDPPGSFGENAPWMKYVYDFLRARIDRQIAGIRALNEQEDETRRFTAELELSEKNYLERPSEEARFTAFLEENQGKVLLFRGESGSGKSTWLKHWYFNNSKEVAASFSDMLHHGKSILYAVQFCVDQLVQLGYIKAPDKSPDYENLVSWFEKILNQVRTDTPVTVVLDCVDQMTDWDQVAGSLFRMKLKNQVRVLIVCADENCLTAADKRALQAEFCWDLLGPEESLSWLEAYLDRGGRRLCEIQKNKIAASLPAHCTALYIYCLSVLCAAQRSFEPLDYDLPETTAEMARLLLERQAKNYYPVFYRHAAGYLALSDRGLGEKEILEILSSDKEVIDEIRTQTEWSWDDHFHIPTVLWSRLYSMISPLLTESYSGGVLTMRFRHALLDRLCLSDADAGLSGREEEGLPGREDAGLLSREDEGNLCRHIRDYFDGDAQPWIFSSGVVNHRKLQELYPILVRLGDRERLGRLFDEPDYPNAMILAGQYRELVSQMMLFRKTCGITEVQEKVLNLLLRHPMLFQTWNDSFLSVAAGRGIWPPEALERCGLTCFPEPVKTFTAFEEANTSVTPEEANTSARPEAGKTSADPETVRKSADPGENIFYLPNSRRYPLALRGDRILAVFIQQEENSRIHLYDLSGGHCLDLGVTAVFRENSALSEGVLLFWKEDKLVVRTGKSRHYFVYDAQNGDFYEERRTSCSDWGQIYKREAKLTDEEDIWEANVFYNKNSNVNEGCWAVTCYREDGFENHSLPYKDEDELTVACFHKKAAVFRHGADIQILDLEKQQEVGRFSCPRCTKLVWNSTGSEVLAVRSDNWLQILPVQEEGKPYLAQAANAKKLIGAKNDAHIDYNATRGSDVTFSHLYDLLSGLLTDSDSTDRMPVCAAMSISKDWCAFYYRYRWQSAVVIRRLSTGRLLSYFKTDPIYKSESCRPVFYAADHGETLVLISRGKRYVLDMNACLSDAEPGASSEMILQKTENVGDSEAALPEAVYHSLRTDHTEKMKAWLPVREKVSRRRKYMAAYFRLFLGNRFSVIPDEEQWDEERLANLPVLKENGRYWLIDAEHSMFHVCDESGRWLCHEQTERPFMTADVVGDTLYLLSKEEADVWEYHLTVCDDIETVKVSSGRTEADARKDVCKEKPHVKDNFVSRFSVFAAKIGTVLVTVLLLLAVPAIINSHGAFYVSFETSEDSGIELEDMSFIALNKDDFSQYSVSYDADRSRSLLSVPSGDYSFYADYNGLSVLYGDLTVTNEARYADVSIDGVAFRFVKIEFYDEAGDPVSPGEVSILEEGNVYGEILQLSGNACYTYEDNTCTDITYLIQADSWEPVTVTANIEGYRTCSISVTLTRTEDADPVYEVAEPNQDNFLIISLLNDDESIAAGNVQVDQISEDGQTVDSASYTGRDLYIFDLEEGFYEIDITCEGYCGITRACVIDEDCCACLMFLKLEESQH